MDTPITPNIPPQKEIFDDANISFCYLIVKRDENGNTKKEGPYTISELKRLYNQDAIGDQTLFVVS